MMLKKTLATFLAAAGATGLANAATQSELFEPYPGATSKAAYQWDYEAFRFPSNADSADKEDYEGIDATGDLFLNRYEVNQVSSLKVYENYKQAALKAGFNIVYECQLEQCGDDPRGLGTKFFPRLTLSNYYRKPYYLLVEKSAEPGPVYMAWFVGAYKDDVWIQQAALFSEPLQSDLITIDTDALGLPLISTPNAPLSEKERAKDHPMLPRYPGAELIDFSNTDTETTTLPLVGAGEDSSLNLTGDLAQHSYEIEDTSTLKVYRNYQQALQAAQFDIIVHCELDACESARTLGGDVALSKSVYNYYRKPYYFLARRQREQGDVYVALFIGGFDADVRVQQVIVEERAVATGLVAINEDILMQQLEEQGKALIYGIYFDTGKATIKPESTEALDAIGALLNNNGDLSLYVVGHTDDTGGLTSNLRLSRDRAQAVVAALTADYGIAAERLQAEGVGPYAPASTNERDDGRQLNRRVELVKRLQ